VRTTESTHVAADEVPWLDLERALAPQQFTSVRFDELGVDKTAEVEQAVPTGPSVFGSERQARQWDFIVRQLKILSEQAQFLALRTDDKDLAIIIGQASPATDPHRAERYVRFVADLLSDLAKAARHFHVEPEVRDDLANLAKAGASASVSFPNTADGEAVAARKLAVEFQDQRIAAVATAAKIILKLVAFRGIYRCVVVIADPHVTDEEVTAWQTKIPRVRRWSVNPRYLANAIVEAWLWDVTSGRVFDAHRGFRARTSRTPIPNLSADGLARNLEFT